MSETEKLRAKIDAAWAELDTVASSMDGARLERAEVGSWAVKDHLAHVAAWEQSLIGLLEGKSRLESMGLPRDAERSTDGINAAIYELHRSKSAAVALEFFRATHRDLMDAFGKLDDAALELPYSHYQPRATVDEGSELPVLGWVAGNTYDHYVEHIGWIKSSSGEGR